MKSLRLNLYAKPACAALAAMALLSSAAAARAESSIDAKRAMAFAQYGNSVVAALKSALATQKIYLTENDLSPYKSCLVRTVQAMMPPGGMKALVASNGEYAQKLQQLNDRLAHDCVPRLVQAVKAKYPQDGAADKAPPPKKLHKKTIF